MKLAPVLFVAAVLALTGCGNGSDSASKSSATATNRTAGNPLTAPVDYLGAVGAAKKQAVKVVDLSTLQHGIQAFHAGEDRLPSSLQELVSEGYLPRLPEAPAGMTYAYHPQSGAVRLVPAQAR